MKHFFAILPLLIVMSGTALAQTAGPGKVLTVTPALAVLGQEIAPDGAIVTYPGPSDENASDWEPETEVLRLFQQADLVLLVGADYAGWVATTALPRARVIDTSAGFVDQYIDQSSDSPGHQHGPAGTTDHHAAYANHFWLDLSLAQIQARRIAAAFADLWPEQSEQIAAKMAGLDQQLTRLQADLKLEFEALAGVNLLASHPVYQYMDRAHGLGLRSFHWEPDRHPETNDWAEFDAARAPGRPSLMIWEADPLPETRAELKRRGVEIVIISPSQPDHQTGTLRSRLGFPDFVGSGN